MFRLTSKRTVSSYIVLKYIGKDFEHEEKNKQEEILLDHRDRSGLFSWLEGLA